ncbi:MAG TPA: sigma factor-like helix-turn-helix DNA-binding protein [Clostridia bacterium]|nr:sigma factor-like helix-turn-helix DNA-binding protein [Clostridia bacterium]
MRLEIHAVADEDDDWDSIGLYREYTVALLRRYFRMSIDIGRLPSVLGGEFFRAKVSSYKLHTFEDVVIFVHDVERCLEKLNEQSRTIIARVVLQEYSHEEVSRMLGVSRRQIVRQYAVALDETSRILLEAELLLPLDTVRHGRTVRSVLGVHTSNGREREEQATRRKPSGRISCQEGKSQAAHSCTAFARK